jgi:DNA-binding CsgD family transcriptional regulator
MLREVLKALSPGEQQLLRWALDGVSLAEMARRLGLTYSTTGVRLHRLKKHVRKMLGM